MRAAPRLNRRHTGTQVDPELGIALAETDRRRPRHQPRKPERRQHRFIKTRGAFEVADADGDVVDHKGCIPPGIETSFRGASKTRTRNLEIPDIVLRTIPE